MHTATTTCMMQISMGRVGVADVCHGILSIYVYFFIFGRCVSQNIEDAGYSSGRMNPHMLHVSMSANISVDQMPE